jgi:2'-5' RNA ligase
VRLFVALQISEEIRGRIAALIGELKPLDDSWKWTRAENLHVTLKFLGETSADKLESVKKALQNVACEFPIPLRFCGLGFFPNERKPRVLWAGMDAAKSLPALALAIDESLARIGFPREDRAFTPHLTLARSKDGRFAAKLRVRIENRAQSEFGATNASAFHLIESKLKPGGAEYTTLESFSNVLEG